MVSNRLEKRRATKSAKQKRASRDWPEWQKTPLAFGQVSGGNWAKFFHTAHHNEIFTVLERHAPAGVRHFMVSSLSGIRPSFHEMQRIKNELAGLDATAIEVYPPQSQLIDGADAYHIWIVPHGLPFGIGGEEP